MTEAAQNALASWKFPIPVSLAALLAAFFYLRGWLRLRQGASNVVPAWRAASFVAGLSLIWLAVASPLAHLDGNSLTMHMLQHLLLMTIAPALIWIGAPVMALFRGLPQSLLQFVIGPVLRWQAVQSIGRVLSHPAVCWLAAAVALVVWHIPAVFNLAMHSEDWHVVEYSSFLAAGFLFWWPVVQPWPSLPVWPRWTILLYLFAATLPCDILSAYLTFCERVVYPAHLGSPRLFGLSALEDQECAGALMWTCVTVIFLVPAAGIAIRLLAPNSGAGEFGNVGIAKSSPSSPKTYQD